MTATRYHPGIAGILFSLMVVYAGVAVGADTAPGTTALEHAAEARIGWDAVGSKAQEAPAVAALASGRAASSAERHQARKREMVRRMFMLMVAYR